MISDLKACVVDAISEIAANCLNGNIPLKNCEFNKLSKYKNVLRKLQKRTSVNTRRKLLRQSGGFLQFLLPPALSFIASILASYVKKKI